MGADCGGACFEDCLESGRAHAGDLGERQVGQSFAVHSWSPSDQEISGSTAASSFLACSTNLQRYSFNLSIPCPVALEMGSTPAASATSSWGNGSAGPSRSSLVSSTT